MKKYIYPKYTKNSEKVPVRKQITQLKLKQKI